MKQVALADDDVELRGLIAELLRAHDLSVLEAADGASLLSLLQRNEFDAVVTDLWMPGLDGNDVLRLRRAGGDMTPFIIITAAPPRVVEGLSTAEHVTVLLKPFTVDMIMRAVEDVLATPSTVAAGTPPRGVGVMDDDDR